MFFIVISLATGVCQDVESHAVISIPHRDSVACSVNRCAHLGIGAYGTFGLQATVVGVNRREPEGACASFRRNGLSY